MKEKVKLTGENYNNIKEYNNYLAKTILNLINNDFKFNIEDYTMHVNNDHHISFKYKIDDDSEILVELKIRNSNIYDIHINNLINGIVVPFTFNHEKLYEFIENNTEDILEFISIFIKIQNCVKYRVKNFLRLSNLYLSDDSYFDGNKFVAEINLLEKGDDNDEKIQEKIELSIEPKDDCFDIKSGSQYIMDDTLLAIIYVIRSYLYDQDSMFRYLTNMEG